jgi:DNA-directed RNA polymerase specialized sigma24 family protein
MLPTSGPSGERSLPLDRAPPPPLRPQPYLELGDLQKALRKLPVEQREAILLIGAEGLTYEETAEICGTKVGTKKSREQSAEALRGVARL